MKKLIVVLSAIFWLFSAPVWAQEKGTLNQQIDDLDKEAKEYITIHEKDFIRPDTSIITGYFTKAIMISFIPDASVIGVYLLVDRDYKYKVDELVEPLKSYFDHYGLPAILVKQDVPLEGKGARMRVYIDGVCLDGDLTTGDLSFYGLQENHEKWLKKIKALYQQAQK